MQDIARPPSLGTHAGKHVQNLGGLDRARLDHALAGLSISADRGERLVHFMGDARCHLAHDAHSRQVCQSFSQLLLSLVQQLLRTQPLGRAAQPRGDRVDQAALLRQKRTLVALRHLLHVAHLDGTYTLTVH